MISSILKTGSAVAAARLVGMGGGFVLSILLARKLGPAGLGIYGYATVVLSLLMIFVGNGCTAMLMRAASRSFAGGRWEETRGILRWSTYASFGVTIVAILAGFLTLEIMHQRLSWTIIPLLAGVLLLDQNSSLRMAQLRGMDQPVWGQLPETAIRPFTIVCCFLLLANVARPLTVTHAFAAMLLGALVSFAVGSVVLKRRAPTEYFATSPDFSGQVWVRSASLLASSALLLMLTSQLDVIVLGFFVSAENLGIYRVSVQISLLSSFTYASLNFIALQKFSFFGARNERELLSRWAQTASRLTLLSVLAFGGLFFLWGNYLLSAVFGPVFTSSATPALWLIASQVCNCYFGFSRTLLISEHKENAVFAITIIGVLVDFAACILLIPRFGILGASVATCVSNCLWNAVIWHQCRRLTGIDTSALGLSAVRCARDDSSMV